VRAAAAGHDLLLVCHTEPAQRAAATALAEAYRSGRLPRAGLEAAAARVRALRQRRNARAEGGRPAPERDGAPLAMAMASRAVSELTPGRAAVADATVLFLYDAHLYPSNRGLLDAVQARARHLAVVLLRDPYDAALLAPGVLGITAFGWRRCQLDAVVARLAYP